MLSIHELVAGADELDPEEKAGLLSLYKLATSDGSKDIAELLRSIPTPRRPSSIPIACFTSILYARKALSSPSSILDVVRQHSKIWVVMPETIKAGHNMLWKKIVDDSFRQTKSLYQNLLTLLDREGELPAINDAHSGRSLTHKELAGFITKFALPVQTFAGGRKPVVAVALPNGSTLAVALLAVCTWYIAAPINPASGHDQFRNDVQAVNANVILVLKEDKERLGLEKPWVEEAGIRVMLVEENIDLTFKVSQSRNMTPASCDSHWTNGPDDLALLLFTSGSSGAKKLVPFPLHTLVSGAAFVIDSWGLTAEDTCLNMMPLNHVGGLLRNVLSPILSGGCVICCSSFDSNLFWDIIEESSRSPTWYYASPSMHSAILAEAPNRANALQRSRLRLVCNAAGALLHTLAAQLQSTFDCTVLPSYGMTECMPISTPPLDYKLERPGTSGISTGSEVCIMREGTQVDGPGEIGRICVRGATVFPGYLDGAEISKSCFSEDGWFDTGDLGYFAYGYLFLTGRSKEVINRGGEIISPFEVEEAIMAAARNPNSSLYNRIEDVMAFSAPHEVLQEVVGVVVVTNQDTDRVSLWQLHNAVKSSLQSAKWPALIVFMDRIPKYRGKVIRMKFSDRIGLDPLSGKESFQSRHYEALCPPGEVPVTTKIASARVEVRSIPTNSSNSTRLTPTELQIAHIFSELLDCSVSDITPDSDFFVLGGDSLKAGRLLSLIRARLRTRLPIDAIFRKGTLREIAELIDSNTHEPEQDEKQQSFNNTKSYSSTAVPLLCFQLLPILVFFPLRRAFEYTLLLLALAELLATWHPSGIAARLVSLLLAMGFSRLATRIFAPLAAILFKWVVVGRYREGVYPMWGYYHCRWWLADKALLVGQRGIFNSFNWSRILYYRLLGARIGSRVRIAKGAKLGEFDLLEIADDAQLDECTCRPFAVEHNTSMYLGRITIGRNSSIGLKSIVAAGASIPQGTCIGPNSSSWELHDASESNRDLSLTNVAETHPIVSILLGIPIRIAVTFIGLLPWMGGLVGLVIKQPADSKDMVRSVIRWWASTDRISFHFLARVLNVTLGPLMFFAAVVAVKKGFDRLFGRLQPGSTSKTPQIHRLRSSLLASLLPHGSLSKISDLFGPHYEAISIAVRLLGGKIGSRVYWPGTGPSVQDYDLIEVGNDVVFGSRSHIVTSDRLEHKRVRVDDGAMIADRVVLLPGVTVGKDAVLGSGALTRRDGYYSSETVWVGSKGGEALCLTANIPATESTTASEKCIIDSEFQEKSEQSSVTDYETSSPFGRAFYEGKATYRVLGQLSIFCYTTLMTSFVSVYWNAPSVAAIQVAKVMVDNYPEIFGLFWWRPFAVYGIIAAVLSCVLVFQAVLALAIVVGVKWALLGRRSPGKFDWDTSDYCQRWQIFLTTEKIRRYCFGATGIIGLLTGTHWAVLYFRALGAKIGKDCALFAGGGPSLLFTEPDLLDIGDRVAIDDASLVSHLNSRGRFTLARLKVGDRCVLRSGSRLLSGAAMENDACLLEHTLVMAGDIVGENRTRQGWPSDEFTGVRCKTSPAG